MTTPFNLNKLGNWGADIIISIAGALAIVQINYAGLLVWLNMNIPFTAINVANQNHWLWGNSAGALQKVILVGGAMGVFYKFFCFVRKEYKLYKQRKKDKDNSK